MLKNIGYTVICVLENPPRAEIVDMGLSKSEAGETMLALENSSFDRFAGEEVKDIRVREDGTTTYLQPDTFFDHRD